MTTPDAPEVTLLRRTLHDVASALDVPDAPLPADAAVTPRRRPPGWRAPLAVAAAVVVLAAGVWTVLRPTDSGDDTAPADDATTDAGGAPRAGWLPEWLPERRTGRATGLPVERARLLSGSGPDDVAVILDVAGGTDTAERAAQYVAPYLGSSAAGASPGPETAILWRGEEAPPETSFDRSVSGWPREEVDMTWVPGVGDTVSVSYEGAAADGQSVSVVELQAVGGSLPDWAVVAQLLDDEAQVQVGEKPAWFMPMPGGGHAVIWQAAEGVTAVVSGWRVAEADLLRIAEESTWPAAVAVPGAASLPLLGFGIDEGFDGSRRGPEDWPTLCAARPGDPALPGEDAGESYPGLVSVTGADDIPYELLVWDDRVTEGGPERTGQCWRLTVGAGRDRFRGGGEVVTQGWGPVTTLVPVAWTAEETVFFAATAEPELLFMRQGDTVVTSVPAGMDDGTRFSFLRVERTESPDVGFELRNPDGEILARAGPLPMDRPG